MSEQSTLFPVVKALKEEVRTKIQAIRNLRKDNSFLQSAYMNEHEEKEKLQEALFALTSRVSRIIQSDIYRKEKEGFRRLGFDVLRVLVEEELPKWVANPERDSRGVSYHSITPHFPYHTEDTIGRRLRELRLPHRQGCKGNCSLCTYGFEIPPIVGEAGFWRPNTIGVTVP